MKSKTKFSLILSIIHYSIVGIIFIWSLTFFTNSSEGLSVLMILFSSLYILEFSIVIPPIIIFFCILGIITEGEKVINTICLFLSILYEVGLIIFKLNYL